MGERTPNSLREQVGRSSEQEDVQALGDTTRVEPVLQAGQEKALRYNKDKLRYDLIPLEWEEELARVLTVGAVKYEPDNWKKSLNTLDEKNMVADRLASMRRHIAAWQRGEQVDQETGCWHMAHAAWNALCIMWYNMKAKKKK